MTRPVKISIALVIVLLMMAAGAIGAGYAYLQYRSKHQLALARSAYERQDWIAAKRHYAWYLTRHQGEIEGLQRYAEASHNIRDNRMGQLTDIGRALLQMAIQHPENEQYKLDALEFYARHRFWRNLEYYATLFMRDQPDNKALQFYKAFALDKSGRRKDAIDAYSVLAGDKGDRPEVYGNLSILVYQEGFTEQSRGILEQITEVFKDDPRGGVQRARYFLETREMDKAQEEIAAALSKMPEDADALLVSGLVAFALKDYAAAVDALEKSVKFQPENIETILHLAGVYERLGKQEESIAFMQGLDQYTLLDNPELMFAMAEMQVSVNRFEDADKTIAQYQKAYPEHEVIFAYFEARKLLARGSVKEAAEKLGAVVKQKPDFARAQFYEAQAYLQMNNADRAKATLEAYMRARPDDEVARSMWNQYFGRPGTLETARDAAEKLLQLAGTEPVDLVMAAKDINRLQPVGENSHVDLVMKLLDQAIARDSKLLDAYFVMADTLTHAGKPDQALNALQRAESAGIGADSLFYARAAIALSQDKPDDARRYLDGVATGNEVPATELVKWAQLFADTGYLDDGLVILSDAANTRENERVDLSLEQISLCARAGEGARALQLMNDLGERVAQDQQAMRKLYDEKVKVARVLLDSAQFDKARAESLLADAEKFMPDDPAVKILKARLSLAGEDPNFDQAETVAERVLEYQATNIDALLLLNEVAMEKGQFGAAAGYAERAAQADPKDHRVQIAVAESLRLSGQYTNAKRWLEAALLTRRNDSRALESLFRVCGESGEIEKAKTVLKRLEAAPASDARRNDQKRLRGLLAMYEKDYAEAEAVLSAYLADNPDDDETADDLAAALILQNRQADAEKFLNEDATRKGSDVRAWCRLGRFYVGNPDGGRLPEASSAFTRAIYIDPDYSPALRGMMDVQLRMKNPGGALSLCDRYLSIQPNDVDVLYQKAELMLPDPKRRQDALYTINKAIDLVEKPRFFVCRGTILLNMGKYAEALADLQRAGDAQAVRSARLDAALAWAYAETKEIDLAKQYAASAGEKQQDPLSQYLLERALKRLEEAEKDGTTQSGS